MQTLVILHKTKWNLPYSATLDFGFNCIQKPCTVDHLGQSPKVPLKLWQQFCLPLSFQEAVEGKTRTPYMTAWIPIILHILLDNYIFLETIAFLVVPWQLQDNLLENGSARTPRELSRTCSASSDPHMLPAEMESMNLFIFCWTQQVHGHDGCWTGQPFGRDKNDHTL